MTMAHKVPYTFPHRSRDAIADYLNRDGRYYHGTNYRFCWNVKAYGAEFDSETMRKHFPDLSPAFDSRWEAWIEKHDGAFWDFCEDAARQISDDEWCSYPGDDQGDWDFSFAGRCGGWIVLNKWRGMDVSELTRQDFMDKDEWPWRDLVAFYRGIRTADSDFTPDKAAREVEYQAAFRREVLEEEWQDAVDARNAALAMAEDRPDLAPAYA